MTGRPVYRKRWGFAPNPAVAREIASLDAQADCQRIVHLLTAYEFSWDLTRAMELALFYTYGSESVSRLLDRTGEFARHGQKRYDDTRLLIAHFLDTGWDGEFGRSALARMNQTHAHYRIPNEDYLFVLWTFIEFPRRWTSRYSRRRMTPHECTAWFHFWREVGQRMGLRDVPATPQDFDRFAEAYAAQQFVPSEASARVATATADVMRGWMPKGLKWLVDPVVYGFFTGDRRFLAAVHARGSATVGCVTAIGLKALGLLKRLWAPGPYPQLVDSPRNRTYPWHDYQISHLRPARLQATEQKRHEP